MASTSTTQAMKSSLPKQAQEKEEAPVSLAFVFARNLGQAHRKSLAESEELHKSYMKMNDSAQRALKLEFMIGYVIGVLGIVRDAAETIINGRVRYGATPTIRKPARTKEQQQAYDAARKMFSFHISRDDKRAQRQPMKQIRLSTEFKDAAAKFVGTFYEEVNAASIGEVIRMLQAFKKRIGKTVHSDETIH